MVTFGRPEGAFALGIMGTTLFALMTLAVRMADGQVHPLEVTFFRALFGLVAILPVVAWRGPEHFRTRRLDGHFVRSLTGIAAMWCGFWALSRIPMAEVVAISYLSPLIATSIAARALGEGVAMRHWLAIATGFAGVLLVAKPQGTASNDLGVLAAFGSAVFAAVSSVSIRRLASTESAGQIVLWSSLIWVLLAILPAIRVWEAPPMGIWMWLGAAGLAGTMGHLCWARALRQAPVSKITPLSFLQLPLVTTAGSVLFHERIGALSVIGSAIVIGANLCIIRAGRQG